MTIRMLKSAGAFLEGHRYTTPGDLTERQAANLLRSGYATTTEAAVLPPGEDAMQRAPVPRRPPHERRETTKRRRG